MLPRQPYHEGQSYPPDPKFPQFGDDMIGGYLDAHAALAAKRRNMMPFHIGQLAEDGFLPLNHIGTRVPATHHNPEDQATQAYDHPSPPPPPPSDAEPVFEDAEGGNELVEYHSPQPPASSLSNTFMNGASSTLADVSSGVAHGLTYLTAAATVGAAKGVFRGLSHFATGENPNSFPSDDEEELVPDKKDVKVHIYPKAKAQSRSRGSQESPYPYPFSSSRTPIDVAPYNGTGAYAITISDEEEEAPGPAAAARRPRNSIRRSDVELARQALGGMGPDAGRGRRRR